MHNHCKLTKHKDTNNSYIRLLLFMIGSALVLIAYGLINIFQREIFVVGYVLLISAFMVIADVIYLKITGNEIRTTLLGLILVMLFLFLVLIFGGTQKHALMWILVIPLIAFYTQEMKKGILFSSIFAFGIIIITVFDYLKIINTLFSLREYLESLLFFTLVSIMTYMYEDTAERKEREIYNQVYIDSLTGLKNRKLLLKDLDLIQSKSLFLLNIDDFKEINDLYGAEVGDLLIKEIAQRLRDIFSRERDIKVYKLHADEFAILLQQSQSKSDYLQLSKRILQIFSENFFKDLYNIAITASLGISDSERDILADTDIALKIAKDKRKSFVVFDKKMDASMRFQENHDQLNRLKKGFVEDSFVPFFQPIIANNSGKVKKYECLIRLVDRGRVILPEGFIALSKRAKLYPFITKVVIDKSFSYFKNYEEEYSINICLDDMMNNETVNYIYEQIDQYKNGSRVVFELLESQQIEDCPEVLRFIDQVRQRGCKIAIDDFGSGYSNFDYILRMEPDYLKIDASLIKSINTDRNSQIITETIVDFCNKLNIKTIAEFVHDKSVSNRVKEMGIDFSQGFYIGKPAPNILLFEQG